MGIAVTGVNATTVPSTSLAMICSVDTASSPALVVRPAATGRSLVPRMLTVTVAVSVPPFPSETV